MGRLLRVGVVDRELPVARARAVRPEAASEPVGRVEAVGGAGLARRGGMVRGGVNASNACGDARVLSARRLCVTARSLGEGENTEGTSRHLSLPWLLSCSVKEAKSVRAFRSSLNSVGLTLRSSGTAYGSPLN